MWLIYEHDEFLKFRHALPDYLKGLATFGYKVGWRSSEITGLTWSQVDRVRWLVRLEVGTTKNDDGRIVYLDNELQEIFQQQWRIRKEKGVLTPYVFPNKNGTARTKDFRAAWDSAFKKSGVERKLFHDLRRTAVRNMVRSGIPEQVAMKISGHKTRSVFERYNIVDEKDLKRASEMQEIYLEKSLGTISGTVVNFEQKKEADQARSTS